MHEQISDKKKTNHLPASAIAKVANSTCCHSARRRKIKADAHEAKISTAFKDPRDRDVMAM